VLVMFDECKLAISNSIDLTGNRPLSGKMEFPHTLGRVLSIGGRQ
jgi:hypothetical protein